MQQKGAVEFGATGESRTETRGGVDESRHRGGPEAGHSGVDCAHYEDEEGAAPSAAHLRDHPDERQPLQTHRPTYQGMVKHF